MTVTILIWLQMMGLIANAYYTHKRIDVLVKRMHTLETGSLRKWVSQITEGVDEDE
jgi:hypothetical protein